MLEETSVLKLSSLVSIWSTYMICLVCKLGSVCEIHFIRKFIVRSLTELQSWFFKLNEVVIFTNFY